MIKISYTEVTYGGKVLYVDSVTPVKTQKTVKQVIGKSLAQINILGMDGYQWELDINGLVFGTTSANLDTNRLALEALDDADIHTYVDGLHNGTYLTVPKSLRFEDTGEKVHTHLRYTVKLVQQ